MVFSLVNWWTKRQEKSKLKKDFLAARRALTFRHMMLNTEHLCGEVYDTAMQELEDRYCKVGLTRAEMDKVCEHNPFIRIE